jgi:quercetin dioxygenase-like cupin family protein
MSAFTLKNILETQDDAAAYGMGDMLEAHFVRKQLDCERTGLSLQRIKPGQRMFGHTHKHDEEIYVVLSGAGVALLGDEQHELRPMDALRVAPGTLRAFAAGPDGLEMLAFGTHHEDDAVESEDPWG